MNEPIMITDDVFWVGVNDRETDLFESLWPLPHGIAYNSYLIKDEKIALIDTVKINSISVFLDKISGITGDRKIDYLIINHMEPDHSGSIKPLVDRFPDIKIVGNSKTLKLLDSFYGLKENTMEVKDGDEIDLGSRKLTFHLTPMVHWPETMMTYDEKDKILFSGDAFGSYGALNGGLFDDEVCVNFYEDEIWRYYSNIVAKFSPMVQKALIKLKDLDIRVIASTHGPVWRKDPGYIVDLYDRMSRQETERGIVIAYASMYGNTKTMVEMMARALSRQGVERIKVLDVSRTHPSFVLREVWKYRGLLLASPTYNLGVLPTMQNLVHILDESNVRNHVIGVFGTYGWSGGGVRKLEEFAGKPNWTLVEPVVEANCMPKPDDLEGLDKLARNFVQAIDG